MVATKSEKAGRSSLAKTFCDWLMGHGFKNSGKAGETMMDFEISTRVGVLGISFRPGIDAGPRFEFAQGDAIPDSVLGDPAFRFTERSVAQSRLSGYIRIPHALPPQGAAAFLAGAVSRLVSVTPSRADEERAKHLGRLRDAYREQIHRLSKEQEKLEALTLKAFRESYPVESPALALLAM